MQDSISTSVGELFGFPLSIDTRTNPQHRHQDCLWIPSSCKRLTQWASWEHKSGNNLSLSGRKEWINGKWDYFSGRNGQRMTTRVAGTAWATYLPFSGLMALFRRKLGLWVGVDVQRWRQQFDLLLIDAYLEDRTRQLVQAFDNSILIQSWGKNYFIGLQKYCGELTKVHRLRLRALCSEDGDAYANVFSVKVCNVYSFNTQTTERETDRERETKRDLRKACKLEVAEGWIRQLQNYLSQETGYFLVSSISSRNIRGDMPSAETLCLGERNGNSLPRN